MLVPVNSGKRMKKDGRTFRSVVILNRTTFQKIEE